MFGYTKVRGLHPLVATAAGSWDVLGVRMRGGNAHTGRGAASFTREVFKKVRAAGATGPLTLRADSGFFNKDVVSGCRSAGARFSISAKMYPSLRRAIEAIDEGCWRPIPYWLEGAAEVAETTYWPKGWAGPARLIVRRVKPTPGSQLALFAKYEYHPFVTDREGDALEVEAGHRRHAEVELVIRDLKEGPWAHMPSGRFGANAAWAAIGAMAHNLARWAARLGAITRPGPLALATLRRRYISVPGHLSRSGRRTTLHLAKNWPWADSFLVALGKLRQLVVPQLA